MARSEIRDVIEISIASRVCGNKSKIEFRFVRVRNVKEIGLI